MLVRMMHIGCVRMGVFERAMPMKVGVRFANRVIRSVLMLVMFIMYMRMCVCHRLVEMFMFVPLREVQPNTDSHEASRR